MIMKKIMCITVVLFAMLINVNMVLACGGNDPCKGPFNVNAESSVNASADKTVGGASVFGDNTSDVKAEGKKSVRTDASASLNYGLKSDIGTNNADVSANIQGSVSGKTKQDGGPASIKLKSYLEAATNASIVTDGYNGFSGSTDAFAKAKENKTQECGKGISAEASTSAAGYIKGEAGPGMSKVEIGGSSKVFGDQTKIGGNGSFIAGSGDPSINGTASGFGGYQSKTGSAGSFTGSGSVVVDGNNITSTATFQSKGK